MEGMRDSQSVKSSVIKASNQTSPWVTYLGLLVLGRALLLAGPNVVELGRKLATLLKEGVALSVEDVALGLDRSKLNLDRVEPLSDSLELRVVKLGREGVGASLVGVDRSLDVPERLDVLAGPLQDGDLVERPLLGGDGERARLDLLLKSPNGRGWGGGKRRRKMST